MKAPIPANESARLEALHHYASPADKAERDFDDLTFLASLICGTPIALISLVGADRQWAKSRIGTIVSDVPREIGFTAHAILQPDRLMVVRDARIDSRFAENPMVRFEPHIRFYAGQPLLSPDGYALGALCVLDPIPRDLSGPQRDALQALARQVMLRFESRRQAAERALTEAELVAARQTADSARIAAEQASAAKSFFLANMSHELRTPLNAIIGYSEMLQEEARDDGHDESIADLEKIRVAGKHLLATINDVLDFSKVEAGKARLHVETFEVDALIRDVIATVRPVVEANGNRLETTSGDGLGPMRSDATKLRQCLVNVLANAGKFTERGTVRFEAWRETDGSADWLNFQVSDTGIGITSEQLGRLFEPFAQAEPAPGRTRGGTGLGLAITRQFCRLLGGDVTVRSVAGRGSTSLTPGGSTSLTPGGSTFTIHLPAEVVAQPRRAPLFASPPPSEDLADGATRRTDAPAVLIVDDDADARELLSRFMVRQGYRVESAASGAEGLRLARDLRPAAILLDVIMPGTDGWDVLASLKADPKLAQIPVIMVTMVDDRSRGEALGAAEHLVKPIDRNRLAEVLHQVKRNKHDLQILVVEDDAAARDLVVRTLASDGWNAMEAKDGVDALRVVAERRPALILLDLMMPRMNGSEFVSELRKVESWRSIPIIVMTAHDLSDAERARLDGCVRQFLNIAPWSGEELLRAVSASAISPFRT